MRAMKRYILLIEASLTGDGGLVFEAKAMEKAPWAGGTLFLAAHEKAHGRPGPYTVEQFCASAMPGWKNVDPGLVELAFDKFVELGLMEVSYLN